ncbi:MAG: 50S ribosomal protein L10 [Fusobacteriaceae bacterium]|nr:50S ribosomal protein L10 [Fusobacteriaceae bacterium]
MVQQYKVEKVDYLKDIFDSNKNFVFNDYSGLNVEKITALRKHLKSLNSKFIVIKNNYIKRIAKEKNLPEMSDVLAGPTAVAFINEDINEVVKILFNYTKESTLKVKGGWAEERFFSSDELNNLSKLPGKKQLIGMLMSTLNAPIQNFVFATNDILGRLVRVIDAVGKNKK